MKIGNIPLARDYLTVANYLAQKEPYGIDYTDLLLVLNGYVEEIDLKPKIKMRENDFNQEDDNNYYGIYDFEELNEYIINFLVKLIK